MDDLKEHMGLILLVTGLLGSGLISCLIYIGTQFRNEAQLDREQCDKAMAEFAKKIDKIEGYLERITNEVFERMRKAETSLGNLWAEHRLIKDLGTCNHKLHAEDEEHGIRS